MSKLLFIFILTILCESCFTEYTPFGYHEKTGILLAKKLFQSEVKSRIVGGAEIEIEVVPYHAGIIITLTSGWTSICGGALVSRNRILTAAHCWWDGRSQAKLFTVVLGSKTLFSGGLRLDTSDVEVHPLWNLDKVTYDIGVVRIPNVDFDNNIYVIKLPSLSDVNYNYAGSTAVVTGFGKTSDAQTNIPISSSLRKVSLKIISNFECQQLMPKAIDGTHMCTSGIGGVGTCDGDSGGPLTVLHNAQKLLVGLVSFGPDNGCQRGYPSVYTRTTSHLTWINSNL